MITEEVSPAAGRLWGHLRFMLPLLRNDGAVEEGDGLTAGAAVFGAEGFFGGTYGNAVIRRPQNGFGVVGIFIHIGEGIFRGSFGAIGGSPEEGHGLCAIGTVPLGRFLLAQVPVLILRFFR